MESNGSQQVFLELLDEYFEFAFREDPIFATDAGIHDYDGRLPDLADDAIQEQLASAKGFSERLEEIDEQDLTLDQRIDSAILRSTLRDSIRQVEILDHYRTNPQVYPLTAMWGVYQLLIREFAPADERYANALSRLRGIPELFEQGRANLTKPPQVFTEIALESARDSLNFYQQMLPAAAAELPELKDDLIQAAEQAASAVQEYIQFLEEELLPRSDGDFAVGREIFEDLLQSKHHLSYTADEMLEVGREQFASIKAKMEDLAKAIDPDGDLKSVMEEVRSNHPEPDELLDAYREEMMRSREFAFSRNLVTVPVEEELEVRETPPGIRGIVPYAMYLPPAPLGDEKLGTFFVTPIDAQADLEARENQIRFHSWHAIPYVALHEGYPGHHLQLVWANTNPSRVRKVYWSTLYVEGWAFYCEELMEAEGYLQDPRTRLLRLDAELWRAARIIADVSLHTQGMTVDQAIELLVESGREPAGARAEVRRYTMAPTQPMSYMIGKLEIQKLVDRYRSEKGEEFDLIEFHEALLRCGSIPPPLAAWQLFGEN